MSHTASQWLTILSLATVLIGWPVEPCRADLSYVATELSWEWLTDASRAIVVGQVVSKRDTGFELKVEKVIKRRELEIEPGQIVGAPVLGRSQLNARLNNIIVNAGWPNLLDPATYPAHGEIRDRRWLPEFRPEKTWQLGDRCLIFFGRDLQCPLQVINLDRPITIEVEFLVVDMTGKAVVNAEDLLKRIASRIAATKDQRGQPRVCSAAISYYPPKISIEGNDIYHVLAPPDREILQFWKPELVTLPKEPETRIISFPNNDEMGEISMLPHAVVYWYLSGLSAQEFASHAAEQRNAAVRLMVEYYEQWYKDDEVKPTRVGVSDIYRYQVYRTHLTNYRTYPFGWLCVWSYDQKNIAFLDGNTLQVYSVDAAAKRVDRLLVTRRDLNRILSYVEFSQDGRMLAYTTEDNSVCLIDLLEGRPLWTAKATEEKTEQPVGTSCLEFSHDQRFLMQQSKSESSVFPNVRSATHAIHVWDVARGEVVFTPFNHWRFGLRYRSFHPNDSSKIRLEYDRSRDVDGIWSVLTGELLKSVARDAEWPSE